MAGLTSAEKGRIEGERRRILRLLHAASDVGLNEPSIYNSMRGERYPAFKSEIRKHLDYLAKKDLIEIEDRESDVWYCIITAYGTDVIDGMVKTPPGIAKG